MDKFQLHIFRCPIVLGSFRKCLLISITVLKWMLSVMYWPMNYKDIVDIFVVRIIAFDEILRMTMTLI